MSLLNNTSFSSLKCLQKTDFQRGVGVYFMFEEFTKGCVCVVFCVLSGKSQGWGILCKIPSAVGGMDIFWNHTINFHQIKVDFEFFLPKHVVYISIIKNGSHRELFFLVT